MKFIFAYFGFVKISKAAIELSEKLEDEWRAMFFKNQLPEIKKYWESQRALTHFLKTGNLLNDERK
jgi:hypothetical protein